MNNIEESVSISDCEDSLIVLKEEIKIKTIELNLSNFENEINDIASLSNDKSLEIETDFNEIIQFLEDFKSKENTDDVNQMDNKTNYVFEDSIETHVDISHFLFKRHISKGGYGSVGLYSKTNTEDEYAIKIVNIPFMKSLNIVNLLEKETDILNLINHDFLVKCYYIFSDSEKYYFVMENIQGGDLYALMSTYKLKEEVI